MIMLLPKYYRTKKGEIKDGILYIRSSYERIMYDLTYSTKRKQCIYCKARIRRGNRSTLDHRYPRISGGVSIVNNLDVCCPKCNSRKREMTPEEYLEYQSLNSIREQHKFMEDLRAGREIVKYTTGFLLPANWITYLNFEEIIFEEEESYCRGRRYEQYKAFLEKYGNLPRPVVVDRKKQFLDGYNVMMLASDFNIQKIPCIILENVEKTL